MTRLASVRVGIAVVSLGMALVGCNCPTNPPGCDNSDLTATFVVPTDGAMVDPTTNVQVSLSRRGEAVKIGTANLEVRGPGQTDFSGARMGMVDGSNATFAGVMLAAGENALRATVSELDCTGTAAPVTITVTARNVVTPPPVIVSCTFPQDMNTDGTLNAAELPAGSAVQLRVVTMNGAGATFSAPNSSPANAAIMNETATISVPGPSADGTFSVTGTVSRGTNNVTCTPMVRVARARPMCTNTTRSLNGPAEDADPNMAGFQLSVSGTVAASVRSVTFSTSGVAPIMAMPVSGAVSGVFTLPAMGDNTYAVRLQGTDVDGNSCDETVMARVDLVAPTLVITAPVQPADGGPATITVTPADLTVMTNADPGSMVCVQRRQGTGTPVLVDCHAVMNGSATVSVPFATSGAYDLIATVTDTAGNVTTRTVSVVVNLMNCGVAFTRPGMCPAYIPSSQLQNGAYTFEISSPNCIGNTARLLINGMRVGMDRTIGSNGTVRVDAPLTNGMFTARAEVVNTTGPSSFVECQLTVDTNAPAWVTPQPLPNMQPLNVTAAQDLQPMTPGVQRQVSFNAVIPTGGRASICTTQQRDPTTMMPRTPCPDGDANWYLLADNVVSPVNAFTFPDGSYSLRVVITSVGISNVSPDLPVTVDAVRPCVLANSLSFPQDTNSDGVLNASELGTSPPRVSFRLDPACGVADLAGLQSVVVRRIVGGAVDNSVTFNLPGDVGVNAGIVTVSLSQNITDASTQFFVQLTKNVSLNQNLYSGVMDPATRSIRIDRSPPTCVFTAPPGAGPFGNGAVPGGMLAATVQTSNDVPSVSIVLGGPMAQNATPMVQSATNTATASFPVTGDNMWTLDATCTDTAGNSTTATRLSFRVDLVAPTCTVTSPATGSSHTTTPPNTSISVVGAEGQPVIITSSLSGTMPLGSPLTVMAGVAQSAAVPYQNSATPQTITASVSDTAGNATTCAATNVTINTTNCNLTLTGAYTSGSPAAPPPGNWVNLGNSTPSGPNRTFVFSGVSSNCVGREARISRTVPVTMPHLQQVTVPMGGAFSFAPITVVDGEQYAIGVDNGSGVITTQTIGVDLSAPTISDVTMNTRNVTSAAALFFVANTLNRNVERGVAGYVPDLNSDTASADVDISITAIGSQSAMFPGRVTLSFTGAMDVTTPISGTSVSFNGRQYANGTPGTLTLTVLEPTGNLASYSKSVTVDVQAPGQPQMLAASLAANPTDGGVPARRSGSVAVGWDPSTNLAGDSSGGYDVRWTTSSVPGACTVPTPCQALTTADEFFAVTTFPPTPGIATTLVPYSAGRISHSLVLPPINTYFVSVRAVDGVGNYSQFSPANSVVSVDNTWSGQRQTLNPTVAGGSFGGVLVSGASIVGDATADLVVGQSGRNTNVGAVTVFTGGAGFGTNRQEILPPSGEPGQFGSDISISGNIGNVGSEVVNDLVVCQPNWPTGSTTTGTGRVVIYFGGTGSMVDTTNFVEIRGSVAGSRFGENAQIIKDIDGDGLDELAIAERGHLTGQGRVLIFKGRDANPSPPAPVPPPLGNWFSSRIGGFIPASSATWSILGPSMVPSGGNHFGRMFGVTSVTVSTGMGINSTRLAIPMPVQTVNAMQLFLGTAVAASNTSDPPAPFTTSVQSGSAASWPSPAGLGGPGSVGTSTTPDGFGRRTIGNVAITSSQQTDLVVSYPSTGQVLIYPQLTTTAIPSPLIITGSVTNLFGWYVSVLDMNFDGLPDLAVGETLASANNTWILYQRRPTGMPLFDSVGPTPVPFWISQIAAPTGSGLGRVSASADVNGDGQPDLVLGDQVTATVQVLR